jgi:hypothetical protein
VNDDNDHPYRRHFICCEACAALRPQLAPSGTR